MWFEQKSSTRKDMTHVLISMVGVGFALREVIGRKRGRQPHPSRPPKFPKTPWTWKLRSHQNIAHAKKIICPDFEQSSKVSLLLWIRQTQCSVLSSKKKKTTNKELIKETSYVEKMYWKSLRPCGLTRIALISIEIFLTIIFSKRKSFKYLLLVT